MRRARGSTLLAVLSVAAAGCGEDDAKDKDRFAELPKRTVEAPADQTAPRWQRIAAFGGRRSTARRVEVSPEALQWRVRWRCRAGRFGVAVTPPPRAGRRRAEDRCPGKGKATWASVGPHRLHLTASAAWRLVVEEELRTPLHEPPLPAMRSGRVRASGSFYPVEVKGAGTASLYRLPAGGLALRMEGFRTEPNPSLVVWLSQARRPKTTRQAFSAPHTELRALKSTIGDQNYRIPEGTAAQPIRSVVIWNRPARIAYAAAALER